MAVVEEGSCDGCGKTFDVDDLHVITINGEEVVCCERCRRHAERAAARSRSTCEGCGDSVPSGDLKPVELPDGVVLQCCNDCRTEASVDLTEEGAAEGQETATGSKRDPAPDHDSAGTGDSVSADAGDGGSASETSASSTGRSGTSVRGSTPSQDSSKTTTPDTSDATESRPAKTENVCDNCKERFTIELYRVETIDGRTEEFCPECKREGVERGVVRDVHLRRAQAFEVLGLTSAADQDSIREAYLRRVKEVHPDREDGNRSEFMLVKRAYERLSEEP